MPKNLSLFFVVALSFLASANSAELASPMPPDWGPIEQKQNCSDISGKFDLIGTVFPTANGSPGTLNYVLQAAIPSVSYDPKAEKYGLLEWTKDEKLKVTIFLGAESQTTTIDVVCDRGWIKLEQDGKNRAEGNTVRYHVIALLARNADGDLVAKYTEEMDSSTLFGLLRSNHTDSYWLRFFHKGGGDAPKTVR